MNSPMKIRSNQHNVSCFMPSYQGSTEVEASICLRSQSRAKQHDTGNTTQSRAKQHDTEQTQGTPERTRDVTPSCNCSYAH